MTRRRCAGRRDLTVRRSSPSSAALEGRRRWRGAIAEKSLESADLLPPRPPSGPPIDQDGAAGDPDNVGHSTCPPTWCGADDHVPASFAERAIGEATMPQQSSKRSVSAALLYVCTAPSLGLAIGLFSTYVVSRLAHFVVVLTHRSHEARALFWTIGSVIVYVMAGAVIWHAATR